MAATPQARDVSVPLDLTRVPIRHSHQKLVLYHDTGHVRLQRASVEVNLRSEIDRFGVFVRSGGWAEKGGIFIELMTSDRKLQASREGSK